MSRSITAHCSLGTVPKTVTFPETLAQADFPSHRATAVILTHLVSLSVPNPASARRKNSTQTIPAQTFGALTSAIQDLFSEN
jgi:hypothetical protein